MGPRARGLSQSRRKARARPVLSQDRDDVRSDRSTSHQSFRFHHSLDESSKDRRKGSLMMNEDSQHRRRPHDDHRRDRSFSRDRTVECLPEKRRRESYEDRPKESTGMNVVATTVVATTLLLHPTRVASGGRDTRDRSNSRASEWSSDKTRSPSADYLYI